MRVCVPSYIYLYNGSKTNSLNIDEIATYISDKLGNIKIEVRPDFISFYCPPGTTRLNKIAEELTLSRVRGHGVKPLPMEIEYEKRSLFYNSFGVLYDGVRLVGFFSDLIPESELEHCHIILTNQLFGTWDENNHRYHARVSIYSFPSIISTTGVVEAPAKPQEYYLKQRLGMDELTLKSEFRGKFIDYDDPRLTDIMKGYVMQAIFFHITGDPFCEDKNCRLYNAHWQEEVIHAQLEGYEFCSKHQSILNEIKR